MRRALITVAFVAISVSGSSIWTHSNAVSYDGFSILEVGFDQDFFGWWLIWSWNKNFELQVAKTENIWSTKLGRHMAWDAKQTEKRKLVKLRWSGPV